MLTGKGMKKFTFTSCFFITVCLSVDSKTLSGRTDCPEGYVLWPVDSTCHRPFSQGPCAPYQQLINHPEVPFCRNIKEAPRPDGAWSLGSVYLPLTHVPEKQSGWRIPLNESGLEGRELDCLSKDRVYWPEDRQCYDLLSAGPCSRGEWLVLEKDGDENSVMCKERVCPCDSVHPEFCEVEVKGSSCRCQVAMAAAQDGLCEPGEQLLLDPFGFGVCGCITSPPHATWPYDGKCYPLYTQGPCDPGYQLSMSPSRLEPSCRPAVCGDERSVMWEDGSCYPLGERGPCRDIEVLSIDEEHLTPYCKLEESKIKRVYDMLPGGFIKDGPISINLKAKNCQLNYLGKCKNAFISSRQISRKSRNKLYVRQRASRSYLGWLRSFRK
jgi:hypothetical protein